MMLMLLLNVHNVPFIKIIPIVVCLRVVTFELTNNRMLQEQADNSPPQYARLLHEMRGLAHAARRTRTAGCRGQQEHRHQAKSTRTAHAHRSDLNGDIVAIEGTSCLCSMTFGAHGSGPGQQTAVRTSRPTAQSAHNLLTPCAVLAHWPQMDYARSQPGLCQTLEGA